MSKPDGGPAYLIPAGGYAFPQSYEMPDGGQVIHLGMTLREWYVGQALAGLAANLTGTEIRNLGEGCTSGSYQAEIAYSLADAMIAHEAGERGETNE